MTASIPPSWQAVWQMHRRGYSPAEIAERMAIRRSTVYESLSRARAALGQPVPQVAAAPGFGHLLRSYRERDNLTQTTLADLVGITNSMVNRLETGSRHPSRDTVLAIAGALDLTPPERAELLVSADYTPPEIGPEIARTIVTILEARQWMGE